MTEADRQLMIEELEEAIQGGVCQSIDELLRSLGYADTADLDKEDTDATRFSAAMRGTIGKRLTYRELAGVEDAGFMGIQ